MTVNSTLITAQYTAHATDSFLAEIGLDPEPFRVWQRMFSTCDKATDWRWVLEEYYRHFIPRRRLSEAEAMPDGTRAG